MPFGTSTFGSTAFGSGLQVAPEVMPDPVPQVTGVRVTPTDLVVEQGDTVQLFAEVLGYYNPSQAVTWKTDTGSVDASGKVTGLTALTTDRIVTVIATSEFDPEQSGSVVFTVKGIGLPPDIDPIPDPVMGLASRFARPVRDISNTGWQASTGTDLFAMLDDPAPGDGDYITASGAADCTLALGPVRDPGSSSGQVIRYPAYGGGSLTVELMQGTRLIASKFHDILPNTPTVHELVLTPEQCDSITDYADLRVKLVAA